MPHRIERESGETIGDQFRLTLPSWGERSVVDTVLGILMFTMSDQIYIVRHNPLASSPASAGAPSTLAGAHETRR